MISTERDGALVMVIGIVTLLVTMLSVGFGFFTAIDLGRGTTLVVVEPEVTPVESPLPLRPALSTTSPGEPLPTIPPEEANQPPTGEESFPLVEPSSTTPPLPDLEEPAGTATPSTIASQTPRASQTPAPGTSPSVTPRASATRSATPTVGVPTATVTPEVAPSPTQSDPGGYPPPPPTPPSAYPED